MRVVVLFATIGLISLLHYRTPTTHIWLHPLLQRAYYVPLLMMAVWYGWRGGLIASAITSILYIPHIEMSWTVNPEYSAAQKVEVGMFFVITLLTGILADHERAQRRKADLERQKAEQMAQDLADANQRLQASFEQLRRADRLSAMGELSAGLAHEIRNPLGSIEGAVQILRRKQLEDETKEEFGELAQRELDRLKGIVNRFLRFARPQPPRRIPTDPMLLLESVSKLVAETAKMGKVQVRVESASDIPATSIDQEQIKQVLLNLAINAIQAMPAGGEVMLCAVADGVNLRLEVQDQGIGIADENLERIFNPFFTTRDEGTGLGLSIAERIVSQHGGRIEPRRNRTNGMTFSVVLPITEPLRADAAEAHK
ncbi:MAG: sensor histidine kinase [Acidobacteriia bacterium]|nr:sensor histidine kinase [Terriglobia bacterium]